MTKEKRIKTEWATSWAMASALASGFVWFVVTYNQYPPLGLDAAAAAAAIGIAFGAVWGIVLAVPCAALLRWMICVRQFPVSLYRRGLVLIGALALTITGLCLHGVVEKIKEQGGIVVVEEQVQVHEIDYFKGRPCFIEGGGVADGNGNVYRCKNGVLVKK